MAPYNALLRAAEAQARLGNGAELSPGDKYGMLRHLAARKNVGSAKRLGPWHPQIPQTRHVRGRDHAEMLHVGLDRGRVKVLEPLCVVLARDRATCKDWAQVQGDGLCMDQKKQGQRAHRYVPGGTGIEWLQQECQADSKCAAVAYSANPQRSSILYTTNGCTHYCTSTEWQTDPALVTTVASYAPYQCWKRSDEVTRELADKAEMQRQRAREVEEARRRLEAWRCPKGQYRIGTTGYVCK